ncbi:MAG: VWA domain-containing protein [Clostridia bacterium]|nr:VWA domain-containing protein [Clostridia bacterium]
MDMSFSSGYAIDIVMCIDATGSMSRVINEIKRTALTFHDRLVEAIEEADRSVEKLRVKVIAFRDYARREAPAMEMSEFFTLPEDNKDFRDFVDGIEAIGGGDLPENSLEALALALRSDWTTGGARRRHLILLFTDAPALPLGERWAYPGYPEEEMPDDLSELATWWESPEESTLDSTYEPRSGRLFAFVPRSEPWTAMEDWSRFFPIYSENPAGPDELDMQEVIELIVQGAIHI